MTQPTPTTSRLASIIQAMTGVPAIEVETSPEFGFHDGHCSHCGNAALVAKLSFDGEAAELCCADCIWDR